jgi:hypothetical protein
MVGVALVARCSAQAPQAASGTSSNPPGQTEVEPLLVFLNPGGAAREAPVDIRLPLITIDGQQTARLQGGQYFSLPVNPGKHVITSTLSKRELDVKPGEAVYIHVEADSWRAIELRVSTAEYGIRTIEGERLSPLHGGSVRLVKNIGEDVGWTLDLSRTPIALAMGVGGSYQVTNQTEREINSFTMGCLKLALTSNRVLFEWQVSQQVSPESTLDNRSWHESADRYLQCVKQKKGQLTVIGVEFADGATVRAVETWCPIDPTGGFDICPAFPIEKEKVPGSKPSAAMFVTTR